MANQVYNRMKQHNEELADYLAELDAFIAITKFPIGFTATSKTTERALVKQERLKDDEHVLEYRVDPKVVRLLEIAFFKAGQEWKAGQRREVLNAFYETYVRDAPCRFKVRLILEVDMERHDLDPTAYPTVIDVMPLCTSTPVMVLAFVFETANDAMLYKLWKA